MMLDHSWQKEVFDVLRVPGPAQVPIPAFDHPAGPSAPRRRARREPIPRGARPFSLLITAEQPGAHPRDLPAPGRASRASTSEMDPSPCP